MTAFDVRPLLLQEIADLLDWARAEGWNPGLDDAEPFQACDPHGFFGGFVGNRMVAGIAAVRYGSGFGFIGLYICRPDCRGRGYGRKLWDHAMAYLDGCTIGLDGVPAQQGNYANMGFRTHRQTSRWTGRYPALNGARDEIVPITPSHYAEVAALDALAFPTDRTAFLARWLQPPRTALALLRDGRIAGYGVLRRCHDGFKIGPLLAPSDSDAEQLFAALAARAGTETVTIDVPDPQGVFAHHLAGLGFVRSFDTARMYRGVPPEVDARLLYGVTTLELG